MSNIPEHLRTRILPDLEVVVANGWVSPFKEQLQFAKTLGTIAAEDGALVRVTAYDDPVTGMGAYDRTERIKRLKRVVENAHKLHGQPVAVVGESYGWLAAIGLATMLGSHCKTYISSLHGYVPVGHHPSEQSLTLEQFKERLREDRHGGHFPRVPSLAFISRPNINATVRATLESSLGLLNFDATGPVRQLHSALPMSMTLADYDIVAPSSETVSRLNGIRFSGLVNTARSGHLDALSGDTPHVRNLYAAMKSSVSRFAARQRG